MQGEDRVNALVESQFTKFRKRRNQFDRLQATNYCEPLQDITLTKKVSGFRENIDSINLSDLRQIRSPEPLMKTYSLLNFAQFATTTNKQRSDKTQEYDELMKALGCQQLNEALTKIIRVQQASKFILRVREMTEACEPHVKNLTLSHCWKFIKEAVFEMQRARKERTGKVGKADSRN